MADSVAAELAQILLSSAETWRPGRGITFSVKEFVVEHGPVTPVTVYTVVMLGVTRMLARPGPVDQEYPCAVPVAVMVAVLFAHIEAGPLKVNEAL